MKRFVAGTGNIHVDVAMDDVERTLRLQILHARLEKAQAEKVEAELRTTKAAMEAEQARASWMHYQQMMEQSAKEGTEDMRIKRQLARPSRFLGTWVFFDDDREKWACAYDAITAYGESPEIACDNFDQLWVFGK